MRFRRTKDELARGLSPDEAKKEREEIEAGNIVQSFTEPGYRPGEGYSPKSSGIENPLPPLSPSGLASLKHGLKQAKAGQLSNGPKLKGDIIIRIRPIKGVDADYFEHLRDGEIVVEQDEHFYKWLDHYLGKVYNSAGSAKLYQDILDQGIGGLIENIHLEKDIKWERGNSSSQAS